MPIPVTKSRRVDSLFRKEELLVSVIVFFFEWKRARCEFSLLNAIYDILKDAMKLQYKEGDDVAVNLL